MKIDQALQKYFFLTEDDRKRSGIADPDNPKIRWDYFEEKNLDFALKQPIKLSIIPGSQLTPFADLQMNSAGFLLASDRLKGVLESYLTDIDAPKWYPAQVESLDGRIVTFNILYFFAKRDFLDKEKSTFVKGTDHPILKRYDLSKIGNRLVFNTRQLGVRLCIHDKVRKAIKDAGCTGIYCYKIHTPGRLS